METKRGEGRIYVHGHWWWVDLTFKGTRFRSRVVLAGQPKAEKLARSVLKKKQVEMAENRFLDLKKETKMTFREMAEKYIEEYARYNKKSWEKSDKCYLVHLNKYFGNTRIDQITREDVLRYQAKRKAKVGASSVNHEISLMRSIYNMAIDIWTHPENKSQPLFSSRNPASMKKTSPLKRLPEESRNRYMTRGELVKFLEFANPELQDYALLAICTGLRKGELKGLSWKKISLDESVIKLKASDTKTAKPRYVPLCEIAKNIIERRDSDFSKDIMRTRKTYPFGKTLVAAEIENLQWRDLRRTFSTYMEQCGVSAERRRRIMGHSDNKMTETYTNVELESLIQEVRKLDNYLRDIVPSSISLWQGTAQNIPERKSENQVVVINEVE